MPIKKAGLKSVRQDKKRRLRNLKIASDLKTRVKNFEAIITKKDKEQAKSSLTELVSKIDKAKNKGILRKNTASRKKSRLTRKVDQLTA